MFLKEYQLLNYRNMKVAKGNFFSGNLMFF